MILHKGNKEGKGKGSGDKWANSPEKERGG